MSVGSSADQDVRETPARTGNHYRSHLSENIYNNSDKLTIVSISREMVCNISYTVYFTQNISYTVYYKNRPQRLPSGRVERHEGRVQNIGLRNL